jgi:glycosyltransferase involved in cell wall biosynthesis
MEPEMGMRINNTVVGEHETAMALWAWGDVWEDFYGTIGVSFNEFLEQFTGSWTFGLVEALRILGIEPRIYYSSVNATQVSRFVHKPTGTLICLIPAPRSYRAIYRRMVHPHHTWGYWSNLEGLFGDVGRARPMYAVLKQLAPYLATPMLKFAREIRRDGCSAILCQEYETAHFDQAVVLGRLMRMPVYATFQGGVGDWNRIGRSIRPLTMKLCRGFAIGSESELQRVQDTYGLDPAKLHRIFNAVLSDIWEGGDRRAARSELGLSDKELLVAWHGRVQIPNKGLDLLLDAWDSLCLTRGSYGIRLLLIGSGPDDGELRLRIQALEKPNVIWIDKFVHDRKRLRQLLSAADVYAFPSRLEGFPVAPTEAMACALPVVTSNASGIADIFPNGEHSGALIVPINDPCSFAQALRRLLEDASLRRELGTRGQDRAREFFSVQPVAEQLRQLFVSTQHTLPSLTNRRYL